MQNVLDSQLNKPTYGVDYMTYKQRRDRIPVITSDYKVFELNSPDTTIDGIPATFQSAKPGASTEVTTTFTATEAYPYIAVEKRFINKPTPLD